MSAQMNDPDNMLNITINGVELKANRGDMIIHAADEAGIPIPRFCYHKKLPIAANCRMCLIEVEGVPKPLPACATPISDGMKVNTRSDLAKNAQKAVMEFLLINHPLDCPICDQGGECELQDVAMGYGNSSSRFQEGKLVAFDQNLGPLISTDLTRCILCTRCVRALEVVGGQKELGATGRGERTRIGTFVEQNVDSEMSGNVIDVCPVGALTNKPFRYKARTWELSQHASVAPHDCVGSNISLHSWRGNVVRAVPRENEPVNEVWISDRDRFSCEALNADDRLLAPKVKDHGSWKNVDWDLALQSAVAGLSDVIDSAGADQLGFLVSPTASVEEMYLAAKLARSLGCNNIDSRLRQSDFRADGAMGNFPGLGMPIAELESCDAVLLIGSNLRKQQPILNHRIRKSGAKLICVNPVNYDLAQPVAAAHIGAPTAMVAQLAGIAAATGAELPEFANGASADDELSASADLLNGAARVAVLIGTDAINGAHFAEIQALAAAIADSCDASLGYLTEAGNSVGAWFAGAVPHQGEAGRSVGDAGVNAAAMIADPRKAYVLIGCEPQADFANGPATMDALSNAAFVVSLNSFSDAGLDKISHVQLPTTPFSEMSASYVNCEGRWQTGSAAQKPKGEARPGWKVLRVLGNLFEQVGFEQMSASEVADELARKCDGFDTDNAVGEIDGLAMPAAAGERVIERIGSVGIYSGDAIVRRAGPLQQTSDAVTDSVSMNAKTASDLGLNSGDAVTVKSSAGEGSPVSLTLVVDERVADGAALVYAGSESTVDLGAISGSIEVSPA